MVLRIGHRGAAGYEPENTLSSFRRAVKLGVDMVELDVHLAKTGELVVIHDDTLKRTTDGDGLVSSKTFKELRELNAGPGQKIPTLEEVFAQVDRVCGINIELKGKGTPRPVVSLIASYINKYGWDYNDFLVSSFDLDMVLEAKRYSPFLRTALNIEKIENSLFKTVKDNGFFSTHPSVNITDEVLVRELHALGLEVYVWSANDQPVIEKLIDMGVDGIFSDYPDRIPKQG